MSNLIGERNLLFGILALHKEFISREALVAAMNTWTLEKKKGLAQILRVQKALTENKHALLEEAIDALVASHGNDLPRSLAAVWLDETARKEMQEIADADVQAALAHVPTEPIDEAEEVSEAEAVIEVEAAEPAPPSTTARPRRPRDVKPSGIPGWVLIAGAAVVVVLIAFLAFRENPGPNAAVKLKGLTTRLVGDGETVSAGKVGLNGTKFESGQQRVQVKAGESITLDIQVRDDSVKISTNGQATAVLTVPPGYPPGAIGLHIAKGTVRVKKFEIAEERGGIAKEGVPAEPLPVAKAGFVPLFNGKDLAGWQPHAKRPGNWRVENGVLIGSAPIGGALYTTRGDYQDFHLRAEMRINDQGFGRLIVRAAYDPTKIPFKTLGYEALINQRPIGAKTGTLTATGATGAITTPAKDAAAPPGEWLLLEILAKGDLVTVKVNGTIVAEFLDERGKFAQKGHIVLQQDANAVLEFRKVEIMDPTAAKAVAPPPVLPIDPAPEKGFASKVWQRLKRG